MNLFKDERCHWSASRTFCAAWLTNAIGYIWLGSANNAVLALIAGVATALIAWSAGPRIAQYIGPQVGSVAGAVGQALKDKVLARRDPVDGIEKTP